MKKRLSVYLEEGINQMVGDIPRPLFILKSRSYVENRIQIGISCSTNVLGGIYGMSNKSNNRKADAML
jgi:hypothetical protein